MRAVTTLQDTTTEVWPGTGQSWWWEHLLRDGVTHFLFAIIWCKGSCCSIRTQPWSGSMWSGWQGEEREPVIYTHHCFLVRLQVINQLEGKYTTNYGFLSRLSILDNRMAEVMMAVLMLLFESSSEMVLDPSVLLLYFTFNLHLELSLAFLHKVLASK